MLCLILFVLEKQDPVFPLLHPPPPSVEPSLALWLESVPCFLSRYNPIQSNPIQYSCLFFVRLVSAVDVDEENMLIELPCVAVVVYSSSCGLPSKFGPGGAGIEGESGLHLVSFSFTKGLEYLGFFGERGTRNLVG